MARMNFKLYSPEVMQRSPLSYAHIAVEPERPSKRRVDVPTAISEIIMKLLAKNPEKRYQTATGLLHDWEHILREFAASGKVPNMTIATRDSSSTLSLPEKLYGREAEIKVLLHAMTQTDDTRSQLFYLSGQAGIGKSALVKEVWSLVQDETLFIAGKCDIYQRNLSFLPLLHAFESLADQVLQGTEEALIDWRTLILAAVGRNGQILIDLVPKIELIIGPQPALDPLGTSAEFSRTFFVVQAFMKVLVERYPRVILFLDDLQWADAASFKLIKEILCDLDLRNLTIIGSFRSDEVSANHPVMGLQEAVEKVGKSTVQIELAPLTRASVTEMLHDILELEPIANEELADGLYRKTAGNPFFVLQFLKRLHSDRIISFDHAQISWVFDRNLLAQISVTANVVDLLCDEIKILSGDANLCLQIACLMGISFSVPLLAEVLDRDAEWVEEALRPCLDRSLLFALNDSLVFAHDKVREAAYLLIPAKRLPRLHRSIAEVMLLHSTSTSAYYFEMVNHFNLSLQIALSEDQKAKLVAINIVAGEKARASQSFLQSEEYFEHANIILKDSNLNADHEYSFRVRRFLAESKTLSGKFAEAEKIYADLKKNAPSKVALARLYRSRSTLLYFANMPIESIECGMTGLRVLGITFPKSKQLALPAMLVEIVRSKINLRKTKPDDIIHMPFLKRDESKVALELMIELIVPSIIARPEVLPVIALKMLNITLNEGLSPEAGYGIAFYGTVQRIMGNSAESLRFHKLAVGVTEKCADQSTAFQVDTMFLAFGSHFHAHFSEIQPQADLLLPRSLQLGAIMYSVFLCSVAVMSMLYRGEPLHNVLKAFEGYYSIFRKARGTPLFDIMASLFVVPALLTETTFAATFLGTYISDEKALDSHLEKVGDIQTICLYAISMCEVAYFAGRFDESFVHGEKGLRFVETLTTLSVITQQSYMHGLAAARSTNPRNKSTRMRVLRKTIRTFEKWAESCPANFLAKLNLLKGELARVEGRTVDALRYYEDAVAEASKHGFVQVEALGLELAGRLSLASGFKQIATTYITLSWRRYGTWQATAKQAALETEFPDIRFYTTINDIHASQSRPVNSVSKQSVSSRGQDLDFEAILRACQTISGEMQLDRLISRMMQLVLQIGGAQRAVLLKPEAKGFTPIAWVEGTYVKVDKSASDNPELQKFPTSIVHLVARTKQSLIANQKSDISVYRADPYFRGRDVQAAVCMPLINQSKLSAVLYLENSVSEGVFHSGRESALQLLSSQMAISIENALLFGENEKSRLMLQEINDNLEMTVKEKTLDVRSILENIPQGIFAVMYSEDRLVMAEDFSLFCLEIAGQKHIAGQDPFHIIFQNSTLSAEALTDIRSALVASLGSSELQWKLNNHMLPNETTFRVNGQDRICEMDFSPIIDQDRDEILKVIVTIKDVSEVYELRKEKMRKNRAERRLVELAAITDRDHAMVMRAIQNRVEETYAVIMGEESTETLRHAFRNVHTIKGLARAYGLSDLAHIAHDVEHMVHMVQMQPTVFHLSEIKTKLLELKDDYEEYERVAREKLGRSLDLSKVVIVKERLESWRDLANRVKLRIGGRDKLSAADLQVLMADIGSVYLLPVEIALSDDVAALKKLALDLGKDDPEVHLDCDGFLINQNNVGTLKSVFTHLLTNAIDHGIESREVRLAAGKSAYGSISLSMEERADCVRVRLSDDGQGLNMVELARKALESGLIEHESSRDAERIAQVLFLSGFTTKTVVTQVSGRGMGMDAVSELLKDVGASLRIVPTTVYSGQAYLPFAFEIDMPREFFEIDRDRSLSAAS